ncbi:Maph19 [Matsumuraeses phaseoli granulovirus]|uniref:Maph19 n=1 Tax=Matsumuraeses phaseoli granulovirus TaxID=2760664 RepID=A0AAE7MLB2_9BBAC|nr:Maph19 [Matsumuraeses phaseoli granulovirus]QOD39982.1 Maph19 [Matsumuraeses phaseoli granulovirus]
MNRQRTQSDVALQLSVINTMKHKFAMRSKHLERMANIEKDPRATLKELQKSRQEFLQNFCDKL